MNKSPSDKPTNDKPTNDKPLNESPSDKPLNYDDEWGFRQFYLLNRSSTNILNNLNEIREKSNINLIPVDVWAVVLGRYGYMSANAIARTCKLFSKVLYKEQFWQTAIPNTLSKYGLRSNNEIIQCISNYFFSQKISDRSIDLFEYLRWIFDKNYFNSKISNDNTHYTLLFRHSSKKMLIMYYFESYNIKSTMISRFQYLTWPSNIDDTSYVYFPYDNCMKECYILYARNVFVPLNIEYYDEERGLLFCGGAEWKDGKLCPSIPPNKKGRWISDHEYK